MQIYRYKYGDTPPRIPCVMALGFFDGVHLGHRDLLKRASAEAKRLNLRFGILTFESSGGIKEGIGRIMDDGDKARALEELGADFTVFADFNSMSGMSPKTFVERVLIDALDVKVAVVGYDYRFGAGAVGDAKMLYELMEKYGLGTIICDKYTLDGIAVSTTAIREALTRGLPKTAARLLGRPYSISGVVEHGRGVGAGLGFPTVNLAIRHGAIVPRVGVYHTAISFGESLYRAVTNVGACPTFDTREVHLEAHIIGYSGNLYGENVTVYFIDYLREETRFSTKNELIMQINIDKNRTIQENGDISWQELGLS